jgi:protein CpxP
MKLFQYSLQTVLFAGALVLLAPANASDRQQTDPALADEMDLAMPFYGPGPMRRGPCSDGRSAPRVQDDGPEHDQPMAMMPPPPHPFAGMPLPMRLHGLQLSETQDDKIFAILYALEPAMREQMKLIRQAQDGLAGLADADDYSEAKLKALTETNAKAMAAVMRMRIRADHQIYSLLTPAQRKQLAARNAPDVRPLKPDAIPPGAQRP